MRYLIDSDWAIDFLNGRPAAVELLQGLEPEGFGISIVSYVELLDGVLGSRNIEQASTEFSHFLRVAMVVDLSHSVADRTAHLRRSLRRSGRQVNHRMLDLFIAATALHHGLVLVTRNTRDYADVPGLELSHHA